MSCKNRHPLAHEVGEGHHLPVGAGHLLAGFGESLPVEKARGIAMVAIGNDRTLLAHELSQPQYCGRIPYGVQAMNLSRGCLYLDKRLSGGSLLQQGVALSG